MVTIHAVVPFVLSVWSTDLIDTIVRFIVTIVFRQFIDVGIVDIIVAAAMDIVLTTIIVAVATVAIMAVVTLTTEILTEEAAAVLLVGEVKFTFFRVKNPSF